ncbi:DUF1257 domain-containing protein [Roseiconus lacunae]|uniref:DUF1257 domain-containing protein n=1 Tax=Roseiconus lacunae TaxID=2605694 RepID=UPI001E2A49A4|nr:DUF1257 domain-containing protein [Roseiconus lacunae]MCD0462486.1 DUF1257 domain-containing protein [Roseiconus lacunae]
MSHIVLITAEIRDLVALRSSCRQLDLSDPVHKTVKLFNDVATGHCVQLPRWRYPVVCDIASGSIRYDNFAGHWGDQSELDRLLQRYAAEKATLEARRQGYTVTEQPLSDGSLKLTVHVGGDA